MEGKFGKFRPFLGIIIIAGFLMSGAAIAWAAYQANLQVNVNIVNPPPTQGLAFFDAINQSITSVSFGNVTKGGSTSIYVWVKNTGNKDQAYYLTNPFINPDVAITWDYNNFIINHGETFKTILTCRANLTAAIGQISAYNLGFSPSP